MACANHVYPGLRADTLAAFQEKGISGNNAMQMMNKHSQVTVRITDSPVIRELRTSPPGPTEKNKKSAFKS